MRGMGWTHLYQRIPSVEAIGRSSLNQSEREEGV